MNLPRLIWSIPLALLPAACAMPGQHATQLAQEQHACAEVGIAPGSGGAFSSCVANLDATMFDAHDTAAR